jgi:cell division transport system ATP-binding protein
MCTFAENFAMESKPIIILEDVVIQHQNEALLKDINLQIYKGEFVYLIGKSGAGKTSLLRALYADLPLSEGRGEICDFDISKIKKSQIPMLRRKLGIVFQDFRLLTDRDIYSNLEFVLKATGWKNKRDIDNRIIEVLGSVGLADKASLPIYHLSEGERQRVAIARAIANNPEVILADEPTGNLDPITSEEIMNLLLEVNKTMNTTILISTHDYIMVEKFQSRVICCENGRIMEEPLQ